MYLVFIALISILLATNGFSEIIRKTGNNGSSTCRSFCAGPSWGDFGGSCLRGYHHSLGRQIGCDDNIEGAPFAIVSCICAKGFEKKGNNGTVSCTDWCSRNGQNGPGPTAVCVGAMRSDTRDNVPCKDTPGFLNGALHSCWCQNSIGTDRSLQERINRINVDLNDLSNAENDLNNATNRLNSNIHELNLELERKNHEISLKNIQLQDVNSSISNLESRKGYFDQENLNLEIEIQKEKSRLSSSESLKEQLTSEKLKLESEYFEKIEKNRNLQNQSVTLEGQVFDLKNNLSETESKINFVLDSVKALISQTGKLVLGGRICTAILIDSKLIRTASHCIGDNFLDQGYIVFGDRRVMIESIVYNNKDSDAAILSLKDETQSFFNLISYPKVGNSTYLLGWDEESKKIEISSTCQVTSFDEFTGNIYHDCDSKPGMSGGALIQKGLVVGVHIGRNLKGKIANRVSVLNLFPMKPEDLDGLQLEYSCDSDCRKEATRKIFGNKIFDPATFSVCISARNSDCAARVALEESARLERLAREEAERTAMEASEAAARVERTIREETERTTRNTERELILIKNNLEQEIQNQGDHLSNQFEEIERGMVKLEEKARNLTRIQEVVSGLEHNFRATESSLLAVRTDLAKVSQIVDNQLILIKSLEQLIQAVESQLLTKREDLKDILNQKINIDLSIESIQNEIKPIQDSIKVLENNLEKVSDVVRIKNASVEALKSEINKNISFVNAAQKIQDAMVNPVDMTKEIVDNLNLVFKELMNPVKNELDGESMSSNFGVNWMDVFKINFNNEDWLTKAKVFFWERHYINFKKLWVETFEGGRNGKKYKKPDYQKLQKCISITDMQLEAYKKSISELKLDTFPRNVSNLTFREINDASSGIQSALRNIMMTKAKLNEMEHCHPYLHDQLDKASADALEWILWLLNAKTYIIEKIGA